MQVLSCRLIDTILGEIHNAKVYELNHVLLILFSYKDKKCLILEVEKKMGC